MAQAETDHVAKDYLQSDINTLTGATTPVENGLAKANDRVQEYVGAAGEVQLDATATEPGARPPLASVETTPVDSIAPRRSAATDLQVSARRGNDTANESPVEASYQPAQTGEAKAAQPVEENDATGEAAGLPNVDQPPRSAIVAALTEAQLRTAAEKYFGAYKNGLNAKARLSAILQTAQNAATSPQRCAMIFEGLDWWAEHHPEDALKIGLFRGIVSSELELYASRSGQIPNVRQVGGFLEMAAQDKLLGPHARKVLRGFVRGAKTQEAIVDLMHNMCCYALETDNPWVQRLLAEIGSFATEIFTTADSQAEMYLTAMLASPDDIFHDFFHTDKVIDLLRHMHKISLDPVYDEAVAVIYRNPRVYNIFEAARLADRDRYWARRMFYHDHSKYNTFEGQFKEHRVRDDAKQLAYPRTIVEKASQLRVLYLQRMHRFLVQTGLLTHVGAILFLPDGTARTVNLRKGSEGEIADAAMAMAVIYYNKTRDNNKIAVENKDQVATALRYIRQQDIDPTQSQALEELAARLKNEIEDKYMYSIRRRGDRVPIDDHRFRQLGMKELLFEQGGSRMETHVTITIGNYRLRLFLDKNKTLLANNKDALDIDQTTRRYWEAALLAYLRELLCREPITSKEAKALPDEAPAVVRNGKDICDRGAHARLLPPGQHYTAKQAAKVAQAPDYVNLATFNETHEHPEGTEYTYVTEKKGVTIGSRRSKPMVSRIIGATNAINAILDSPPEN